MSTNHIKSVRAPFCRLFGLLLIAASPAHTLNAATAPVTSVAVEPQEAGDSIVTFAHPFKKGEVKDTLTLKVSAKQIPTQVDVKRRYPDGSVKHAIISAHLGGVTPGRLLRLDIHRANEKSKPESTEEHLLESFPAEVTFRFPDGSVRRAKVADFHHKAARKADGFRLAGWLEGPLVSEELLAGPPCSDSGDPDPDLLVIFGLRLIKPTQAVRLEVVVESPWIDVPGNIPYDVTVSVDGKEVFEKVKGGHWTHRMPYWLKDKDRNLAHFAHAR